AKTKDFSQIFENQEMLGFPYTRFFLLPPNQYQNELNKILVLPTPLKPGEGLTADRLNEFLNHRYLLPTSNPDVSGNIGSSYRNYLEGEHFQLILVNQSQPASDYFTVSNSEGNAAFSDEGDRLAGTESGDSNGPKRLTFKVETRKVNDKLIVAWPKSAAIADVTAINNRSRQAVASADSEKVAAKNQLLNQSEKAKINTLYLSPDSDSTGVLRAWSRYLVFIPEDQLTEAPTQSVLTGNIAITDSDFQNEIIERQIAAPDTIVRLGDRLRKLGVMPGYQVRLSDPKEVLPSGYDGKLQLAFDSGSQMIDGGKSAGVVARIHKSAWGTYWDGTRDPMLSVTGGHIEGVISGFVPSMFGGSAFRTAIRDGYPRPSGEGNEQLYWADYKPNPNIEVSETSLQLLDMRGRTHADVAGSISADG
ncbi:hypothetical protein EBR96_10050, partial [bacterium]|nr:hypothetical protein [bacterium]